jgi:hypothetical protein
MNKASTGLHDRLKKTLAISRLGQGMDIGSLNEYSHEIALYLLLKVFHREINNNNQRTKNDLIEMASHIVSEMKLNADIEQIKRLVDGVLYYGDPRQQSYFSVMIYNEESGKHEEFKFRYLIPDREASGWDKGGSTVYMLSETAQEIIFITREVLQEFGFDLEQFYTLQLIKNGNFSEAKGSVSNLIARVRSLIKEEKDWREDILRNPGLIFAARKERKKRTEGDLREQFAEEKRVFADMFSWRDRLNNFPTKKKKEGELLFEELERARALHDRLAELAISNLALELEIRKENPDIFWKTSQITFKKDYWQDSIINSGLPDINLLEDLLNPLFSPEQDFIFPLDWAWSEQQLYTYLEEYENDNVILNLESPPVKVIDWELVIELWESVFEELMEKGKYSLRNLEGLEEEEQLKWLSQDKNLELFIMFIITDVILIKLEEEYPGLDERLVLYNKLIEKNDKFSQLTGQRIIAHLNPSGLKVKLANEFEISEYTLYLEEVKDVF